MQSVDRILANEVDSNVDKMLQLDSFSQVYNPQLTPGDLYWLVASCICASEIKIYQWKRNLNWDSF